jgi:hypothetical protein
MASKFALVFIAAVALAGCAHQQQYVAVGFDNELLLSVFQQKTFESG